jgi:ubiquinone/menaquinone biosynthesis C-methylase UbiE
VAKFNLETRSELVSAKKSIKYIHNMGEDTSFGPNDFDHVSMSLVSHELPAHAAKAIFKEAYRILPSGGVFSFMDIDPESLFFQKFASNPIAFTAFKSTEPWIQEYVSMDLVTTLKDCGYKSIQIRANSPRHRTVVAFK